MEKQNIVLLIGAIVVIVLSVLWKVNVISEPDVAIAASILTGIGYFLALIDRKKEKHSIDKKESIIDSKNEISNFKSKNKINLKNTNITSKGDVNIVGGSQTNIKKQNDKTTE